MMVITTQFAVIRMMVLILVLMTVMTVFRTNEYSDDDDDDDDDGDDFGRVNYDICNENCFDDAKEM